MSDELRTDIETNIPATLGVEDFERVAGGWSRVRRRHVRTAKWRERDRAARALRWRRKRSPDALYELPPLS